MRCEPNHTAWAMHFQSNEPNSEVAMTKRSAMDPLKPVLRHVEEELQENMEKVCDTDDVAAETTGELEKLSETLSSAARQAKAAAGLRRRMNSNNTGSKVNQRLSTPPDSETVDSGKGNKAQLQ
jgi:hypothetical protein